MEHDRQNRGPIHRIAIPMDVAAGGMMEDGAAGEGGPGGGANNYPGAITDEALSSGVGSPGDGGILDGGPQPPLGLGFGGISSRPPPGHAEAADHQRQSLQQHGDGWGDPGQSSLHHQYLQRAPIPEGVHPHFNSRYGVPQQYQLPPQVHAQAQKYHSDAASVGGGGSQSVHSSHSQHSHRSQHSQISNQSSPAGRGGCMIMSSEHLLSLKRDREREGRCADCGAQTHEFVTDPVSGNRNKEALTIQGEVHRGRCLLCFPIPAAAAAAGGVASLSFGGGLGSGGGSQPVGSAAASIPIGHGGSRSVGSLYGGGGFGSHASASSSGAASFPGGGTFDESTFVSSLTGGTTLGGTTITTRSSRHRRNMTAPPSACDSHQQIDQGEGDHRSSDGRRRNRRSGGGRSLGMVSSRGSRDTRDTYDTGDSYYSGSGHRSRSSRTSRGRSSSSRGGSRDGSRDGNDSATSSEVAAALESFESPTVDLCDVIATMRRLVHSSRVQTAGCEKLWIQSWDDENSSAIGRVGGIATIIEALRRHCSLSPISIGADDPHSGGGPTSASISATCSVGGGTSGQRRRAKTSSRLAQCACGALQNLALNDYNRGLVAGSGGPRAIVDTMSLHTANVVIQQCGCTALANIAAGSDDNRSIVAECGGMSAVLLAVEAFPEDDAVLRSAYQALRALGYNPTQVLAEVQRQQELQEWGDAGGRKVGRVGEGGTTSGEDGDGEGQGASEGRCCEDSGDDDDAVMSE